jgi:uncharacterized membrane protein
MGGIFGLWTIVSFIPVVALVVGLIVFIIFIAMYYKLEGIDQSLKGIHSLLKEEIKRNSPPVREDMFLKK